MATSLDRDDDNVPEAAVAVGVSLSTIRHWIDEKKLPVYGDDPRSIRIKRDDLAAVVTTSPFARTDTSPAKEIQPDYRVEWTPELRTQQHELIARILADQKGWSTAPLTTADLIRQVRREREERHASWSSVGRGM